MYPSQPEHRPQLKGPLLLDIILTVPSDNHLYGSMMPNPVPRCFAGGGVGDLPSMAEKKRCSHSSPPCQLPRTPAPTVPAEGILTAQKAARK